MTQDPPPLIALGKTELRITPIGIGAWQWGDRWMWGYGRGYDANDIQKAFQISLEAGINFVDTAEVYGNGQSERMLGGFLQNLEQNLVVATKFMPFPWRLSKKAFLRALQNSLQRLQLPAVDLYQIHQPLPPVAVETWADALADAVQAGLVRAVGVSNYDEAWMRRAYTTLARRGVPLASNQVQYHLLDRRVEFSGLLKVCQELGITVIAYSPLAKGVLSGKYTPENPPPGIRSRRYHRAYLEKIQPLLNLMSDIGRDHGGRSLSQVALNWCIGKGSVPIPGPKNARQATDICGALAWKLSDEEMAALDVASEKVA